MNHADQGYARSLWKATGESAPETPECPSRSTSNVVVIGGGITGLSTALSLCEAGFSVTVLEAREIGWGASGRNGGQVNPAFDVLPSEIIRRCGDNAGERLINFASGVSERVFDLIERHDIRCAAGRGSYLRGARGRRGMRQVERWVEEWRPLGAPVEMLSKDEAGRAIGSNFFSGAMVDGRAGTVNPLSYVRGLARAALQQGVRVHCRSPVRRVRRRGNAWCAETEAGSRIEATHLAMATNGYTGRLWPGLRQRVVPVASLQTATAPLPQNLREKILPAGHHVSETRRAMVYFRIDDTGRFLIGGRGSVLDPTRQFADTAHLRRQAVDIFPDLKDVPWEFDWGGLVAITKNHLPHLMDLGGNACAGFGYNGRGIAMATSMGDQLARLIRNETPDLPVNAGSAFRMHAFRNIGVGLHMLWARLLDHMDR